MTIWTGLFFSQLCKKWVLGRNGLGGSSGTFSLQVSLCWLMAYRFLSKLKGFEAGGSDFALCICDCYEGVYLSPKEGSG